MTPIDTDVMSYPTPSPMLVHSTVSMGVEAASPANLSIRLLELNGTNEPQNRNAVATHVSPSGLDCNNLSDPQPSSAPIESFPMFSSGDVYIRTDLVSPTKQWRLHSTILARQSTWFAQSIQVPMLQESDSVNYFYYTIEYISDQVTLVRQRKIIEPPKKSLVDETTCNIIVKQESFGETHPSTKSSPMPESPGRDHTNVLKIYDSIFEAFFITSIIMSPPQISPPP